MNKLHDTLLQLTSQDNGINAVIIISTYIPLTGGPDLDANDAMLHFIARFTYNFVSLVKANQLSLNSH